MKTAQMLNQTVTVNELKLIEEVSQEVVFKGAKYFDLMAIATLLASVHLTRSSLYGGFNGSEDSNNITNAMYVVASVVLGEDLSESDTLLRSCGDDGSRFVIESMLSVMTLSAGLEGKIFAVAFEACGVLDDDWEKIITSDIAQLWTDSIEVTEGRGWSEEGFAELSALSINAYVDGFGEHRHSLFRVA